MERVGRNILRGTGDIQLGAASWDKGTWLPYSGNDDSCILATVFNVTDAPSANIYKGVRMTNPDGITIWNGITQDENQGMKAGETYTLSCYARITKGGGKILVQFDFVLNGIASHPLNITTVGSEWTIYSYTYTIPENSSNLGVSFYLSSTSGETTMEVCGMKLEKGDTATAWSPAPEDSPSFAQCYLPRRASGRSIEKAVVELDRSSWTYDGREHVPKVTSVTLEGKALTEGQDYTCAYTPATDAGSYHVLVKGAKSYKGTIAVPWKIEKAAGSVSVKPGSVTLFGLASDTATAELEIVGDGAITFGASDYVSLSREGNTITVTPVSTGNGTVDIILGDGFNYTGARTSLNVDITLIDPVFENNSWETIATVAAMGRAQEFWRLGDKKSVTWNGETYHYLIGDFDHFDLATTDARYNDPTYNGGKKKAAITLIQDELFSQEYAMYDVFNSKDNANYEGSDFYKTHLSEIVSQLDSDFVSVVRKVSILTCYGGYDISTHSTDADFFLISQAEIFGPKSNGYYASDIEGKQIELFRAGNSKVKYLNGNANNWLTRSPATGYTNMFVGVDLSGKIVVIGPIDKFGIALCANI